MSTTSQSKIIGNSADNDRKKRDFRSCNCKRSSCLKLYCECFANAFHCIPGKCNCHNCLNNLENEVHRRAAVEYTLDRNPMAFRSKIGTDTIAKDNASRVQSHHKGCNCKKSNCLKKYCECFQASIVCTERCRCMECKNFKGSELRNEAIQRLKEVDDDFYCSASVMSAELKRSHPSSSLVAFYSSQTSMLYEKLLDKMKDSIRQSHVGGMSALSSVPPASADCSAPVLKKQRIAKEFSQCLDAIIDQTELLYNVGKATYGTYKSGFLMPSVTASEPFPQLINLKPFKYMEPLQSISSASAMIPPPTPAETLISSIEHVPPPLPSLPHAPLPSSVLSPNPFPLSPIVTSSPEHRTER